MHHTGLCQWDRNKHKQLKVAWYSDTDSCTMRWGSGTKDRTDCFGRTTHKCSQKGVCCSLFSYCCMLRVVYSLILERSVITQSLLSIEVDLNKKNRPGISFSLPHTHTCTHTRTNPQKPTNILKFTVYLSNCWLTVHFNISLAKLQQCLHSMCQEGMVRTAFLT